MVSSTVSGFTKEDVRRLLMNKFVVIIGDSIQRGIYKDIVFMLQCDSMLREKDLKAKGEFTFCGDELVEGGKKSKDGLNNGINYSEVRQYATDTHLVRFYFITRCYNAYVESIFEDLKQEPQPDLVIMNSCLWDMTRYGSNAINEYKLKLQLLMARASKVLPSSCLFIWNTTMPISKNARGGFLVPEVSYRSGMLRLDVLEANFYAARLAREHNYDVLDLHFYFRGLLDLRVHDGIHWCAYAHRRITNILLNHVSQAWGVPAPPIGSILGRPLTNMNRPSLLHRPVGYNGPKGHMRSVSSTLDLQSNQMNPYPLAAMAGRVHNPGTSGNQDRRPLISRQNEVNSRHNDMLNCNMMNRQHNDMMNRQSSTNSGYYDSTYSMNVGPYSPDFTQDVIGYGSHSRYAEDHWFSQQCERQAGFFWEPYASDQLSGRERTVHRDMRQHYRYPY